MKSLIASIALFSVSCVAFAQSGKDSSATSSGIRGTQLSFGVFSGENLTKVNPNNIVGARAISNNYTGRGFDYDFFVRLKTQEGIFVGLGFNYEMQSYKLSEISGSDSTAIIFGAAPSTTYYTNANHYISTFDNYYLGIPLSIGYAYAKKRYSFYVSLGLEFYDNYKTQFAYQDSTTGIDLYEHTYTKGRTNQSWDYEYNPLQSSWDRFGIFGVLNMGVSYNITPRFSAAFEPLLRFTNPFAANSIYASPSANKGQATLSLNIGLNYSLNLEDTRYLPFNAEQTTNKIGIGLTIMPNWCINPAIGLSPTYEKIFTYSYMLTLGFTLSNQCKIESGIVLDNFATSITTIGIPAVFKYYLSDIKATHKSFYFGAGGHIDYSANIEGYQPFPAYDHYILPIGLVEAGYKIKLGSSYFFDFGVGYEHEVENIYITKPPYSSTQTYSQLPHIFFSSIGLSYQFE